MIAAVVGGVDGSLAYQPAVVQPALAIFACHSVLPVAWEATGTAGWC